MKTVVKTDLDGHWDIQLRYKLEAETFQEGRKFSRIWFGPDHLSKLQTVENVISIDYNKNKMCSSFTAYLKVLYFISTNLINLLSILFYLGKHYGYSV